MVLLLSQRHRRGRPPVERLKEIRKISDGTGLTLSEETALGELRNEFQAGFRSRGTARPPDEAKKKNTDTRNPGEESSWEGSHFDQTGRRVSFNPGPIGE